MKVLLINTKYQGGGAEKVARQLYQGLPTYGVQTAFLAGRNRGQESDVPAIYSSFGRRAWNYANRKLHNNAIRHDAYAVKQILRCIEQEQPDIVHFHNVHGHYMGIADIAKIAAVRPVVWTLHDMWALTGHCCICIDDCTAWYENGCAHCDKLGTYSQLRRDASADLLRLKKMTFAGKGIYFVTPSRWLEERIRNSYLGDENIRTICNGVDTTRFRYLDKAEIKKKYGISQHKKALMFLGTALDNEIKGIRYLIRALELLPDKETYFLLMVGDCSQLGRIKEAFAHKDFGYVKDTDLLNEIYAAADLFIFPSVHESAGLMAVESGASGTACVAFDSEGIPEAVTEDVGWLVPRREAEKMSSCIQTAFADRERLRIKGQHFRQTVEQMFSLERMLRQYAELYGEVVKE
ncbi:MAG: glycosyltransferase [Lachnospiraceae bacterium]|nr:glycosyltransferase [Lachnospiraceae bacterium]